MRFRALAILLALLVTAPTAAADTLAGANEVVVGGPTVPTPGRPGVVVPLSEVYVPATCTSDLCTQGQRIVIGTPAVPLPWIPDKSIPSVPQKCTPAGVACVGPTNPIPLPSTPEEIPALTIWRSPTFSSVCVIVFFTVDGQDPLCDGWDPGFADVTLLNAVPGNSVTVPVGARAGHGDVVVDARLPTVGVNHVGPITVLNNPSVIVCATPCPIPTITGAPSARASTSVTVGATIRDTSTSHTIPIG